MTLPSVAEAVGTPLFIIAISSAFAIAERHGVHGVGASILVACYVTVRSVVALG